jgi:aminopeptidase N
MMLKIRLIIFYNLLFIYFVSAQNYTAIDSLKGSNHKFRDWWNVLYYNLTIEPNIKEKSIEGTVQINFIKTKETPSYKIQVDLQEPMQANSFLISFLDKTIPTTKKLIPKEVIIRENDFYFIDLSKYQSDLDKYEAILEISFSGHPKIAENAPWKGGWVFDKDKNGNPFVSVACQGDGASLWFPNKDYWGDEPDFGAKLNLIVPNVLVGIGNGKLIEKKILPKNKTKYSWEVTNPINGYNLIPYIGDFTNFFIQYEGINGSLDLDFWVLKENLLAAKNQFTQVPEMLKCFEEWMGPYPFYQDGYKLVEAPYVGMEHQSNIAYGNQYKNGYFGNDLSETGWGLNWDYIIVHESGHEWFGNAITAKEPADLWIHEAFTTYTEVLFTECKNGQKAANEYAIGIRKGIKHDVPIMGQYGINKEGSMDMYRKGANMIHTLRQIINNDQKFKSILQSLVSDFKNKTIETKDIINKINLFVGKDLTHFFYQYLKTTEIPRLIIKKEKNKISYKWDDLQQFPQNFSIKLNNGIWIHPTSNQWRFIELNRKNKFEVDKNFYIETKEIKSL